MARERNVSMPYSLCCASSKSARVLANSVRLRLGYSRRNRPTGVSVWFLPQANTSVASGNLREVSLYVSLASHHIIYGFERALGTAQLLLLKGEGGHSRRARYRRARRHGHR